MTVNEKGLEAALLPCPLCGSPAFMDGKYWVCCNNGDCQTSTRPFETEAEAIAAWNKREALSRDTESGWRDTLREWHAARQAFVGLDAPGGSAALNRLAEAEDALNSLAASLPTPPKAKTP